MFFRRFVFFGLLVDEMLPFKDRLDYLFLFCIFKDGSLSQIAARMRPYVTDRRISEFQVALIARLL